MAPERDPWGRTTEVRVRLLEIALQPRRPWSNWVGRLLVGAQLERAEAARYTTARRREAERLDEEFPGLAAELMLRVERDGTAAELRRARGGRG